MIRRNRWAFLVAVLLLGFVPRAGAQTRFCVEMSADGETAVSLEIDEPQPGTLVRVYAPECPEAFWVRGYASAIELGQFDIYIIIDTSGSTGACSGADVNGNGYTGHITNPQTLECIDDRGDSILEAEIEASRRFVDSLDPASSRVAIIDFAAGGSQCGTPFNRTPDPPAGSARGRR